MMNKEASASFSLCVTRGYNQPVPHERNLNRGYTNAIYGNAQSGNLIVCSR